MPSCVISADPWEGWYPDRQGFIGGVLWHCEMGRNKPADERLQGSEILACLTGDNSQYFLAQISATQVQRLTVGQINTTIVALYTVESCESKVSLESANQVANTAPCAQ